MTGRTKTIWVVLALVAMIGFIAALPLYKKATLRAASAAMVERTQKAVEKKPELKADYDKAIQEDGVLTYPKAKAILEKAGEKVEPEN